MFLTFCFIYKQSYPLNSLTTSLSFPSDCTEFRIVQVFLHCDAFRFLFELCVFWSKCTQFRFLFELCVFLKKPYTIWSISTGITFPCWSFLPRRKWKKKGIWFLFEQCGVSKKSLQVRIARGWIKNNGDFQMADEGWMGTTTRKPKRNIGTSVLRPIHTGAESTPEFLPICFRNRQFWANWDDSIVPNRRIQSPVRHEFANLGRKPNFSCFSPELNAGKQFVRWIGKEIGKHIPLRYVLLQPLPNPGLSCRIRCKPTRI